MAPLTIPRSPVDSSNLATLGYHHESQTLDVEFKSGKRFRYSDVPEEVWNGMNEADSKGSYFAVHIRSKFPAVKMGTCEGCAAEGRVDTTCEVCGNGQVRA